MRKIVVDIKEVWSVEVVVEVPDDATKDEILETATKKFEEGEHGESEYSHTLDRDVWTVRELSPNRWARH